VPEERSSLSARPRADEQRSFAVAGDGTRLFVRTRQGAHPLDAVRAFFCDGILCEGFIWKYAWDSMAAYAPLVHWNYRGHGRSSPPKDPDRIDVEAHADDLMTVRRHVGDPPCVLIGHSMGCQVALECAHQHPERVRGLVLICGSYGKVTRTIRGLPVLDWVLPRIVELATKRASVVRALWSRIPPEMAFKLAIKTGDLDAEKIRAEDMIPYFREMAHIDATMFLRMLRAAGEHSAESYLAQITVPTLIIAGERDTLTPAYLSEAMASQIPGAELFVVPGGTHVSPIEQPDVVDERIATFWKRVAP
jgi:pimeloyl-ACP methyl ester carboxylesterase